jgi:hypothetical protein
VIGLLYAWAASPTGKEPILQKMGGPQSQSRYFKEERKQLPLLGNKMHKSQFKIPMSTAVKVIAFKWLCNGKKNRASMLSIRSNKVHIIPTISVLLNNSLY